MHPSLEDALTRNGGVIGRRDVPGLCSQIDWAIRRGELARVLKGVYARAGDAATLPIRARAVGTADPDAVICGFAAGVGHGWFPRDDSHELDVASARLHPTDWLVVHRRVIPRELTRRVDGVRFTSRALTAVDLIPEYGSAIVDEALRRRVRSDELRWALASTPRRPGNRLRHAVLTDSRDRPWSAAERVAHRALRAAGLRGWVANRAVIDSPDDPPVAVVDIALVELRLGVEIDGAERHDRSDAFSCDRSRDERLARLGWQVVRFTARRVLEDQLGFASSVIAIARTRAQQLAVPWPPGRGRPPNL